MVIILICIIVIGLAIFVLQSHDEHDKVSKMTNEEKHAYFKSQRETSEKAKYNQYMFTCPMCGSKKVIKITNADRVVSAAALGIASGKIGKQYECANCKHRW